MRRGFVVVLLSSLTVVGCASVEIVDKTEMGGGKTPSMVAQLGGGAGAMLRIGEDTTTNPTMATTFTINGGGGYSHRVANSVSIRTEIYMQISSYNKEENSYRLFGEYAQWMLKFTFGDERVRASLKGGVGVYLTGMVSGDTLPVLHPKLYAPVVVMLGFGSPERTTVALSAPPFKLWFAFHPSEEFSFWLGVGGWPISLGREMYGYIHGGIGYWIF